MKNKEVRKLVLTAMFAALIAVSTAMIKIPTGINGGYVHLGDSMVYLAGCLLGPYGAIASSIGGALADIIAGAAVWALPTAIIKPLNSLPFILATSYYVKHQGTHRIIHPSTIGMTVVSGFITILGYYIAEGLLFSFQASLITSMLGLVQPVGSAIVFIIVGYALDRIKIQKYLY